MASGCWSARVRGFHQSSHLGDEFIINNPAVERKNLSFEAVDVLLAVEERLGRVYGRVYGGGAYIVSSANDLDPGLAQWGVEIRGPLFWPIGDDTTLRPVVAGDGSVSGTISSSW